jgi:pilus assembly protein Flp/PilA
VETPSREELAGASLDTSTEPRQSVKETTMSKFVTRFMKDESGATAIEYGLIAALVAVVLVTALTAMGTKLSGTFDTVSAKLP